MCRIHLDHPYELGKGSLVTKGSLGASLEGSAHGRALLSLPTTKTAANAMFATSPPTKEAADAMFATFLPTKKAANTMFATSLVIQESCERHVRNISPH